MFIPWLPRAYRSSYLSALIFSARFPKSCLIPQDPRLTPSPRCGFNWPSNAIGASPLFISRLTLKIVFNQPFQRYLCHAPELCKFNYYYLQSFSYPPPFLISHIYHCVSTGVRSASAITRRLRAQKLKPF